MASKSNCVLHNTLRDAAAVAASEIGNNGTEVGGVTYEACRWGNGAHADATGEAISFPDNAAYRGLKGCIRLTIRTDGWNIINGGQQSPPAFWSSMFAYYKDANNIHRFTPNHSTQTGFNWQIYSGGVQQGGYHAYGHTIPDMDGTAGTDYHIAVVWNKDGIDGSGDTQRIYWEGVLVSADNDAITVMPNAGGTNYVANGFLGAALAAPTVGTIANIQIFDTDETNHSDWNQEGFSDEQVYDFGTPAEYAHGAGIEVTGGAGIMKKVIAASVSWFCRFAANINADYSRDGGALAPSSSARVEQDSGGKFDGRLDAEDNNPIGGNDAQALYDAANNFAHNQIATIATQWRGGYSGDPGVGQNILLFRNLESGTDNLIYLSHATNGNLITYISDDAGNVLVDANVVVNWTHTAGVFDHIELDFDFTGGAQRFFVNGTQIGSTYSGTGTCDRSSATYRWYLAGYGSLGVDMSYDEPRIDDVVLHTSNFTAPTARLDIYDSAAPTIETCVTFDALAYSAFAATETLDGGTIRYTIKVDGMERYWTGAAWATSDGTYAQASSSTDINTNIGTLSAGITAVVAYLSSDGLQQPSVDEIVVGYTEAASGVGAQTLNVNYW